MNKPQLPPSKMTLPKIATAKKPDEKIGASEDTSFQKPKTQLISPQQIATADSLTDLLPEKLPEKLMETKPEAKPEILPETKPARIPNELDDLLSSDLHSSDVRHSSPNLGAVPGDKYSDKTETPAQAMMLETWHGKPNILLDGVSQTIESTNSSASLAAINRAADNKTMAGIGSPARYEVDVQHYAQYDKSEESGYTDETRKSLSYASKTPFGRFLADLQLILSRPTTFWKVQSERTSTLGELYWPFLIILVLLRTIAVMSGSLIQYAINDVPLKQMLVETGVQTLLIFLMIWVFSLIISGISTLMGSGFQFEKAHRFVGYSMTPILVVGILGVLPIPFIDKFCDIIAMPWAFLVMGAGMLPFLKIKQEQAPVLTGFLCGMLLIMWGLIPMAIPRIIAIMM